MKKISDPLEIQTVSDIENMDIMIFKDKNSPDFPHLYKISLLKMLFKNNPLGRKRSEKFLAYPWVALAIAEKYDLCIPLWACRAMMAAAARSISRNKRIDISISVAQITLAEKHVRLLQAVAAYEQEIRGQFTLILAKSDRPTTADIESAYRDHVDSLKDTLVRLKKKTYKTESDRKAIASVQLALKKSSDTKSSILKKVADSHDVSSDDLRRHYSRMSLPKKNSAKKKPTFSLHTLLPDPCTE
jgi:hypothetical protein